MSRPLGVTILAILAVIWGILSLISGVSLVAILSSLGRNVYPPFYGSFGWINMVVYAAWTALGIFDLVIAYGYWKGRGWAWTIGISLAVIGIMLNFVSLTYSPMGVFNIVIQIIVIYYLTRTHVKEFFGKHILTVPPPAITIRCPKCGYNNQTNFNYCGRCGAPLTEEETKIY